MDRHAILKQIRRNGAGVVAQFLPSGAHDELEGVIRDRRHEVDPEAFLMFVSIRALLGKRGMPSRASDCEAGWIMAMLNT